jgi:4-carboxymuconolactone decarboxylase
MTRITPITDRAQLPPEQQHEWDAVFARLGRVRGPFGVMLNSAGLSTAVQACMQATHVDGVVSDPLHELAILAVAREDDAPYQWSVHVAIARQAGLSEAAIEVARSGGDHTALEADERDVIEVARQLCRTNRLDQPLYDALAARHGDRWLMLVIATIGFYRMVATFNNAFDVDPLPGDDQLPVG